MLEPRKSSWLPATALHVIVLLHHATVVQGFVDIDRVMDSFTDPVVVSLRPFRLLTISGWCFGLQMTHVNLALAARWQQWRGDERKQRRLADHADSLFRALVLPCVLVVSVVFWSLYLVNRDLVYPAVWDAVVPCWINHGVHTSTAVFALLELALVRRGPGNHQLETAAYWTFSVGYSLLMNTVYFLWGTWFYPFLALGGWGGRLAMQTLFCLGGRIALEVAWRRDRLASSEGKAR